MTDFPAGHSNIYQFLYHWQTLISAILALGAAIITIMKLSEQIRLQERQHKETRESKAWAARAQLIDCLDQLSNYAESMAIYLIGNKDAPFLPDGAAQEINKTIEFLDPSSSQRVFEILRQYQILKARTRYDHALFTQSEQIYDAIYLRALTESLFDFARRDSDGPLTEDPSRQEMINATLNCSLPDRSPKLYHEVVEKINALHR